MCIRSSSRAPRRCLVAAALLGIFLLAAPGAGSAAEPPPSVVILISLDGTRPADVEAPGLTTLAEIRRRGASAKRLIPVFPTNTFPNHVSLVTGVAPEVHGVVNNTFLDPERGKFDKESDPSWLLTEPLWSIAAQHKVVSAAYHWVGSEGAWTSGRGPKFWKKFDDGVKEDAKVDQILAWLAGPEPRPRLVTAWFHGADHAAHLKGVDSPEAKAALAEQDVALGRLVAALDARGAFAWTTLLLVSDHGMANVRRRVDVRAALRAAKLECEVFGAGGMATISCEKGKGLADEAIVVMRRIGLEAWPRDLAPRGLSTKHPRFGDVVVIVPVGGAIQSGRLPLLRGSHGNAPWEPAMGAIFMALGRGVPAGADLGELNNLDVAPTVLRLLGLEVPPHMTGRVIRQIVPEAAGEPVPAAEKL